MKCKFCLLIIFSLPYFMTSYGFRDCLFFGEEHDASKENCADIILPNSECCIYEDRTCAIYYEDIEVKEKYYFFINLLDESQGYQEFIAQLNSQNSEDFLQCKTSNIKTDRSKISITEDQYNNIKELNNECLMHPDFDVEDESECFHMFIFPELEKKGMECCYFEMQSKQNSSEIERNCIPLTKFERTETYLTFYFSYMIGNLMENFGGYIATIRLACNDFKLELDYENLSF